MVKVTCDRCGALYELDDASVPPSGKIMKCLGCGNAMTVMPGGAGAKPKRSANTPPPIPKRKAPPPIPPKATKPAPRPATPAPVAKPAPNPDDALAGNFDLADVPAPKRSSPLAGAKGAPRKEKRASLLDQAGLSDLPAPAAPKRSGLSGLSAATDLPAPASPKSKQEVSDLPAPVAKKQDILDLPAPVDAPRADVTGLPAPVASQREVEDLPAPVAKSATLPVGTHDSIELPTGGETDFSDLLAPVDRSAGPQDDDLLAPLGGGPAGDDLLAPKSAGPAGDDLLAPKSAGFGDDLLAPRSPGLGDDLLTPKRDSVGNDDLLTPKLDGQSGDDLLTPKRDSVGSDDLLTPKGGLGDPFGDLPAPSGPGNLPAPKQGDDDRLPAPKGFFDDVTGPKSASTSPSDTKGFFDDIPAPADPGADLLAPTSGDSGGSSLDLDDLDLAPPSGGSSPPPSLELGGAGGAGPRSSGLELGGSGSEPMSLDLDGPGGLDLNPGSAHGESAAMPLELGDPAPSGGGGFGEVDLPSANSVVTFSDDPPPRARPAMGPRAEPAGELELDGEPLPKKATTAAELTEDAGSGRGKAARGKAKPGADGEEAKKPRLSRKTMAMVAAAVVVVGVAGAGGFMYYQGRKDAKNKAAQVNQMLNRAAGQLVTDAPNHWQLAANFAGRAHRQDKGNTRALALMAQATFAHYLDQGTPAAFAQLARAKQYISKLESKNARGPEVAKADALRALVDNPPNTKYALDKLMPLVRKPRVQGPAQLYLGWAYAAAGQHQRAIDAYKKAIAQKRNITSATYWLGRSYLANGDDKAARESFDKVLKLDKAHVGALLGTYQLANLSLDDRMKRYDGLLKRKDIKNADMRVRALANALIGDLKLRSGGIEEAKRRYDAALKLDAHNLPARIGKAKAAFRLGRFAEARTTLELLLRTNPTHIEGLFVLARVAMAEGKLDEAQGHIDKVLKRQPPIKNDGILLTAQLIQGDLHAAAAETEKDSKRKQRRLDAAIAAYSAAKKHAAGSGNIQPNVALTIVLTKHPDKAKQDRAAAELDTVKAEAKKNPAVAAKLGLAFLNAGQPERAATWFRTSLDLADNIETRFQLGVALRRQEKYAEAIKQLDTAFRKNESREDIGLELAILYETKAASARKRQDYDAAKADEHHALALYQRLLGAAKPSLNVRARAGLFYARLANIGTEHKTAADIERAKQLRHDAEKQGRIIVAEKRDHPAGNFLLGEGAFARDDFSRARNYYRKALQAEPAAQYYEGLGRTFENLDPPALDKARANYMDAVKADADYLPPRFGVIRVRMKNQNFGQALVELERLDKLRPRDPWVWRNMGECQLKLRRFPKAVAAFSLAVAYGDNDPYTSYRLGRAYFDDNRIREATKSLDRATKLIEKARKRAQANGKSYTEPSWTVELYRQLGYAYRERGERRAAIRAWREYLQRNPRDKAKADDVRKLLIRLGARR